LHVRNCFPYLKRKATKRWLNHFGKASIKSLTEIKNKAGTNTIRSTKKYKILTILEYPK
jgi:hypothetical protein